VGAVVGQDQHLALLGGSEGTRDVRLTTYVLVHILTDFKFYIVFSGTTGQH